MHRKEVSLFLRKQFLSDMLADSFLGPNMAGKLRIKRIKEYIYLLKKGNISMKITQNSDFNDCKVSEHAHVHSLLTVHGYPRAWTVYRKSLCIFQLVLSCVTLAESG